MNVKDALNRLCALNWVENDDSKQLGQALTLSLSSHQLLDCWKTYNTLSICRELPTLESIKSDLSEVSKTLDSKTSRGHDFFFEHSTYGSLVFAAITQNKKQTIKKIVYEKRCYGKE